MKNFLAPCGMNCALCHAYQRKKNACAGCRAKAELVHTSCRNCAIAHCDLKTDYCNECEQYPCKQLSALDKRYRTKYRMSMISNLARIKEVGEDAFVVEQQEKYACPVCGKPRTVHNNYCIYCEESSE